MQYIRHLSRVCVCFVTVLLVSGCLHRKDEGPQPTITASKTIEGTSTKLLPSCPLSSASNKESIIAAGATLLGPLAAKGIEKGVEALAAYFERRAKEQNAKFSSRGAGEYYNISGNYAQSAIKCVVVMRGTFGTAESENKVFNKTTLNSLGLAEPPAFYFEAALIHSAAGNAFRLEPAALYFAKSHAKRPTACKAGDNCKTINIVLGFEGVTKDKEEPAPFGTAAFSFPNVAEGSYYDASTLSQQKSSSEWIVAPEPPTKAKEMAAPISVLATVQESAEDDDFLLAVAAILKEKKTDIGKAIGDAVADAVKPKSN